MEAHFGLSVGKTNLTHSRFFVTLSCEVKGQLEPAEARAGPQPVPTLFSQGFLCRNSLTILRPDEEVVVNLCGSVKDGKS